MKLSEIAFFTDNVDAVCEFYERSLGINPAYRGPGIAIFQNEGTQILIHATYAPAQQDPPCENHFGFNVPDLDHAVGRLQAHGMTVQFPSQEYEWGRSAYLRDPDGKLIELHEAIAANEGKRDE